MLVLLDLIGAPDPTFYNYFSNTEKWYSLLITIENKLAALRKFESYSYGQPTQKYFQPYSMEAHIEDDHIPFLQRGECRSSRGSDFLLLCLCYKLLYVYFRYSCYAYNTVSLPTCLAQNK